MVFLILKKDRSFLKHLKSKKNHRYKIEIAYALLLNNGNTK